MQSLGQPAPLRNKPCTQSRKLRLQVAVPVAVSLLLVMQRESNQHSLVVSFVLHVMYFTMLLVMVKFASRKRAVDRKTVLLSLIAFYPIILPLFEDKRLLLFTSSLSGLLCVMLTESIYESVLIHLIHGVFSYISLFCSVGSQTEGIDFVGWKIGFVTSFLWIFVYGLSKGDVIAMREEKVILMESVGYVQQKAGQLEAVLQDKENFILSFSHELKNLLNVLLGNLTLATKINHPSINKFLKSASLSGEVMKLMVLNVLDEGKHELKANLEIKMQRMHVPTLLENIWGLCAEIIASNHNLKGKILLSAQVPLFLRLDPQRMLQIVLNLVTNAVKFTERGSIVLKVCWEETKSLQLQRKSPFTLPSTSDQLTLSNDPTSFDDDMTREKPDDEKINVYQSRCFLQPDQGFFEVNLTKREWIENFGHRPLRAGAKGLLKISIQDTGCGMSQAQCDKLFSRFSQVSEDEGKRRLGTGLGLWITKQIIEQHQGTIDVESKEGLGTRFDITIPTFVEDSIGSPSIEIPNETSIGTAKILSLTRTNLTRGNLSKINLTRNNLTRLNVTSLERIPETHSYLNISPENQKWASTTSLDTPEEAQNLANSPAIASRINRDQMKILVADDDAFSLELMGKLISEIIGPDRVILARNGAKAQELINSPEINGIRLALIDKNLGDMSGLRLIQEIKEAADSQNCEAVHCFLVSGESGKILQQDLESHTFLDGYLTKPIEFDEFEKIISEYYFS